MAGTIYNEDDLKDVFVESHDINEREKLDVYYCKATREYTARWMTRGIAERNENKEVAIQKTLQRGVEYDAKAYLD